VQAEEYARMRELEDHYWWFVGRRRLALKLLRKYMPPSEKPTVLDLGCGTGAVACDLSKWARPVGIDMSDLALRFSHGRGLGELVRARGEWLPVRGGSMDAVIALDIFEHIDDDMAAFWESMRVLRPGGVLVLSVPAFRSLWGPHDVALMHFRRYRAGELAGKLREAGFEIRRLSYSVFFLFPVVVLVRLLEKASKGPPQASLPKVPSWINRALAGLQDAEAGILSTASLPWGSSVIAVARKPLA